MTDSLDNLLFIAAAGKVEAIYADTGASAWMTKLESGWKSFGLSYINLLLEPDLPALFAIAGARAYRLDPFTGVVIWGIKHQLGGSVASAASLHGFSSSSLSAAAATAAAAAAAG